MPTKDMSDWKTSISKVISSTEEEEVLVRGQPLSQLIGEVSFSEMIFLMLQGNLPTQPQARVLEALLVASMEHGIAPPSMVSRCFASYGTSIQAAIGGGILAFGDRMGGLGEQLAQLMVKHLEKHNTNHENISDAQIKKIAEEIVSTAHDKGHRVPGYGIPLHITDPRAPKVLEIAHKENTYGSYCRLGCAIEFSLAAKRGGKKVPMNLDGVSAAIILDLGFTWQSTRLFLLTARSISMGAHFLEEKEQNTTWRHIPAHQIKYTS